MTALPASGAASSAVGAETPVASIEFGAEALCASNGIDAILERARFENFPVASRLLPQSWRWHLHSIYAFARLADDLGDEAAGDRLALLDGLERELDRVYAGEPRHPVGQRLAKTVRECSLPREPFENLIEANRLDQRESRYATFESLRAYCDLSANPVGRLVLQVFGAATPERIALSDRVCTALQLAEHCQDVGEDRARDRIYLPREDLDRFGCSEADLASPRANENVRELLRFQVTRSRGILEEGAPLVSRLSGRARLAVAGFVAGGHAALDGIARRRFDVLSGDCRVRRRDFARHFIRVLGSAS